MSEERARALADEYGVPYIDTSAKDNHNVNEAFMQLATSIKKVTECEAAAGAAAAAAAGDGATASAAGAGSAAGEVQPLVLTGRPEERSSSGGCC